jgi:diguanylate cyclase (GGDEF)-like protein
MVALIILILIVYTMLDKIINKLIEDEKELKLKQDQLQVIIDNNDDFITLLNNDKLVLVNNAFLISLGCKDMNRFISKYNNLSVLFLEKKDTFMAKNAKNNLDWIKQIHKLNEKDKIVAMKHKKYGINYFNVKITRVPNQPNSNVIIFSNITSLFKKSKYDEYTANHDNLTKIFNRQYFNKIISKTIFDAKYTKHISSLLMFDLDYFKKVNDTYGHQIGDEILIKFAQIISYNIRDNDIFARWGGEEFVLLLIGTSENTAKNVANHLRQKIENEIFTKIKHITCSIGVSQYKDGDSIKSWLSRVDKALYKAKKNSRNRVEVI